MPFTLYRLFADASPVAQTIIAVAILLFGGFAATRLTKLAHLPSVTAYILTGILLGPYCLGAIPPRIMEGTEFLPDIALAFIAFSVGEYFTLSSLRRNGGKVVLITVLEACAASAAVFVLMRWVLGLSLPFSAVLAALAAATAPASTVITIRQTGAHGDFVDTLLQVVALDDVVGLVLYSIAISVALAAVGGGGALVGTVVRPILVNLGVLVLGGGFGWLLKLLFRRRSVDNRLIVSVATLFAFCGICALLDVSPLLGCMSMGTVYINLTGDEKLFRQLNYWSPPLLLLFFVRSGLSFRLDAILTPAGGGNVPLLVTGVGYFAVRILGKYVGAFAGCLLTGKSARVRNWLGLALIPQAGVAIGLAALGARTLGDAMGADLQTVILASSVLYELVGPACAKLSLHLSGSYADTAESTAAQKKGDAGAPDEKFAAVPARPVDVLIAHVQQIQSALPPHAPPGPEELAFDEAAEEQYELMSYQHDRRFRQKRR